MRLAVLLAVVETALLVYSAGARAQAVAQEAYLKASNTLPGDDFGYCVAVSGDTAVVGAWLEDIGGFASGAAYVFVRNGGVWSQQAYLNASNTDADDRFGASVALSGDTVVVGAPNEANSGAAYVFVRSGGVWSQQAYLKASNSGSGDSFGWSVAVSDDTVVVGAWGEDSSATGVDGNQADNTAGQSGAAYVFVRNGTSWNQEAYLKASNTDGQDQFGISVGVSGDIVVAGANAEDSNATGVNGNQADNSASNAGAAYVFVRNGSVWSQQAYLKASNTGMGDNFGSVAVSGDTVVVGAIGEDSSATGVNGNQADNSAGGAGATYVFTRDEAIWSQHAYLKASNTGAGDHFGFPVAVSADTVVVGAADEDSNAMGVNGNQADDNAFQAGAAYVFVRNAGALSQQAYLKASNSEGSIPGGGDEFGYSVAVSGDLVVIGAHKEDSNATGVNGNQTDNSAADSGAAYVFDGFLDIDGDGVPNADDPCPINNAALSVDNTGRPLSDLNEDCNVNGLDMQIYVNDPSQQPLEDFVADLLL